MEPQPHRSVQPQPIARLTGVEKTYPGVKALKGVDFEIYGGEIHCLVGENGAGKSTLMRVLTGAVKPDAGKIEIDGNTVVLDPASAISHGIGIVYQELDLIPAMSVAENIFLGHEPLTKAGLIDWTNCGAALQGFFRVSTWISIRTPLFGTSLPRSSRWCRSPRR